MAKRLTKKQKEKIIENFKKGKTPEYLSKVFDCAKLTIIRNLKLALGEDDYKKLVKAQKISDNNLTQEDYLNNVTVNNSEGLDFSNQNFYKKNTSKENSNESDFNPPLSFLEITPVDFEIDNVSRKELSSVHISEVKLPEIVYMIVDKKIELQTKFLRDFPEWEFLPIDDLNRKTIEIFFDLKVAKRQCNKEQKVIKVPNTNVFRIAAPFLLSNGISRIVSNEKLIAL